MFYWDKTDCGSDLGSRLYSVRNVKRLFVATAFISSDGVGILQKLIERDAVKRSNVTVCLSAEFSDIKPSDILTRLNKIADVRIAKDGRMFHPKLYYIEGESEKLLIYGSSNLTGGGFGKNIEFDGAFEPSAEEIAQVHRFIDYCMSQTTALTDAHIEFYKSLEAELSELTETKYRIKKKLGGFEKREDPFDESTYDLSGFYFDFADYETFFPRNVRSNFSGIRVKRDVVKKKLLAIHESIEDRVNELDLYAHWDKSNITSLTFPCSYNNFSVAWMGVRYGKRKDEVLFGGGTKEPYESFTKHACLQCNIDAKGFEVVLFFAVRNEALDRQYLRQKLYEHADEINEQARKLRGHGLVWKIEECPDFSFDDDDDLVTYLKQNDRDGRFSSMTMFFAPDDPRIKTLPDICREVLNGFSLYKPLYDLIAWRAKER